MHRLTPGAALAVVSTLAIAGGIEGVWKTRVNDKGGYLEVTIGPCETDPAMTCGRITNAFNKHGADPAYVHIGELMIKNMNSNDGTSYSGGTLWDPLDNKTYKSKLQLKGDVLDVEGCVSFVCSGQDWSRVK